MGVGSWLDKFGHAVVVGLNYVLKGEAVAKPIVETYVPASAAIFGVFDTVVEIVKDVQAAFSAAGAQSNGPAMLAAATPGVSAAIDTYITAKFPGSEGVLKADAYLQSKTQIINAVVAMLNALPDSLPVTPTTSATVAAAAVKAATSPNRPDVRAGVA